MLRPKIGLETEEAVRRNLAASLADEQGDSSPDKPLSDEAAAERLQWQEWQEWNGEGEGYGKDVEQEQFQTLDQLICFCHEYQNQELK